MVSTMLKCIEGKLKGAVMETAIEKGIVGTLFLLSKWTLYYFVT